MTDNTITANISGAIFDLDGTILDSMHIWSDIGIRYLLERGLTPEKDLAERFNKMSLLQAAEYYKEVYKPEESVKEICEGINRSVEGFYYNEVLPKQGIKVFLEKLKSNAVKMCVATATDRYLVEVALKRNNLLDYFSDIFTCTTVGAGKDEPVIYQESLKHLGTPKESTLVFEDAPFAAETAKNDGFTVVGIADDIKNEKALRKLSDYYISDYAKVRLF